MKYYELNDEEKDLLAGYDAETFKPSSKDSP